MTERDDGLSRRKVLECMTSAGTGVRSRRLALTSIFVRYTRT
jgi:hypothetical protein